MKCFTRFVGESFQKRGFYAFESSWWTYRHLNMSIFRLGTLEFEFENAENGKVINIHIPTDAGLHLSDIKDAFEQCKAFAAKFYPEYINAKFTCHTWLLSPTLTPLLNENSNILRFQKLFNVMKVFEDEKHYFGWLFLTDPETPVEQLKEDTSLQKKVKVLLKKGVNIGAAYGELKEMIVF